MVAEQIMSDVVPALKPRDYCNTALSWMEVFKISHLPVVQNQVFRGMVSDTMIYDANTFDVPVAELKNNYIKAQVEPHQHILEIINTFHKYRLTALPVVKDEKMFKGLITLPTLIESLSDLFAADSPGSIIILEIHANDYSLSQIAQIVESNEARILACYISNIPDSMRMRVTLKVNKNDLTSIIRTFERYEYEISASYSEENKIDDVIQDRFDSFMQYLDI